MRVWATCANLHWTFVELVLLNSSLVKVGTFCDHLIFTYFLSKCFSQNTHFLRKSVSFSQVCYSFLQSDHIALNTMVSLRKRRRECRINGDRFPNERQRREQASRDVRGHAYPGGFLDFNYQSPLAWGSECDDDGVTAV